MRRKRLFLPYLTAFSIFPALLHAGDGVLEINQACVAQGCFAGDSGLFPVQITGAAGRSYRLTSDLVAPTVDTTVIEFSGTLSGVTLDLGGFTIRGPVSCTGTPNVCSAPGSGNAIARNISSTAAGISVRNGTIIGMGNDGIQLTQTENCVVEGVVVRENGGGGVLVGDGSRVHHVTAVRNGADGISTGGDSLVESSLASSNSGRGIGIGGHDTMTLRNVVVDNGDDGIAGNGFRVAAIGNTVRANNGFGILPGSGALVMENAIEANGALGASAGVSCGTGCRAHGNAVRGNFDTGLTFSTDGAYSDNNITANTAQPVSGGGTPRGGNLCNGPGTVGALCP